MVIRVGRARDFAGRRVVSLWVRFSGVYPRCFVKSEEHLWNVGVTRDAFLRAGKSFVGLTLQRRECWVEQVCSSGWGFME
jgi:hypothetical protein